MSSSTDLSVMALKSKSTRASKTATPKKARWQDRSCGMPEKKDLSSRKGFSKN